MMDLEKDIQYVKGIGPKKAYKLNKLLQEFDPEYVISTHPFSSQMCAYLKKLGKLDAKIATVMTDYAPHDQWLVFNHYVDYYFVSKEEFEKFKNKYINFADDRSKDICMNKLGMEPNDFSDMEKHHAAYIKEVTKDNKTPLIDSNTGRYKAYDDPTNFPIS